MARIRTLKPSFWGSPEAAHMSREARLLTVGLISFADDQGRFLASFGALSGFVYPNDEDVTPRKLRGWLDEVVASGMVELYEDRGVKYGHFPSWRRHQVINKPSKSVLPTPPQHTLFDT